MGIGDVPGLQSIVAVLAAMEHQRAGTTAKELCASTALSRGTIDWSLRVLVAADLVSHGTRRFGVPVPFAVTAKGQGALRHLRGLELLLAGVTSLGVGQRPAQEIVVALDGKRTSCE